MLAIVASFVTGFVLTLSGWWFAARTVASGADAAAFESEPALQFMLLASVEVLVAATTFAIVTAFFSRARHPVASGAGCFVAFAAGAMTSTVSAGPYALVPRVFEGEAQLVIYVVAAATISALLGGLVAAVLRKQARGEG
ncbi:MAG TPA: hypothetical protein VN878_03595 [Usitatibacter sp.]|nr:hypothetical protein [Usitatibacter sp.]